MSLVFDTGSSWTWLPNEDCPDAECPLDHNRYRSSPSYQVLSDESYTIEYGIGMVEGFPVSDHIALTASEET